MEEKLIAPCGMNCTLCIAYQGMRNDLNKLGFHRKYCPGCFPRGESCTHIKCELLSEGIVRFCTECEKFPCERLKSLDKRYRTKYHMSMIENLKCIRDLGMEGFLKKEAEVWRCGKCGGVVCCHNGLCLGCEKEVLKKDKKYRWNEK